MKRSEIELLLPRIFQRGARPGQPLSALLEVMEALHQPDEEVLERLDAVFNPYWTRDDFCPFLAQWVDLDRILPVTTGSGCLRQLIASATELAQWRGTAGGLIRFLETATGMGGFQVDEQVPDEGGRPKPFHFRVVAPAAAAAHRAMILRIIESEKPAYATYELVFGERPPGGG
jgi:phage tail-like protein